MKLAFDAIFDKNGINPSSAPGMCPAMYSSLKAEGQALKAVD